MRDTINKAQEAMIERNDLVVQIAKVINPSAFTTWTTVGVDQEAIEALTTRQRYQQAEALRKGADILKMLVALGPDALSKGLIEHETAAWKDLLPECTHGMIDALVAAKHN